MAWLEEDYKGKTSLPWWKISFKMASEGLFSSIDQLALQDVQVHNMPWIVQTVHIVRLMVSHMNEKQPWYAEYMALTEDIKDPNAEVDEFDEEEEDDGDDDDGNEKQRWDETFASLGKALRGIKALTADLDDWFRIGNKRRLGKHLWHNRRIYLRVSAIADETQKLWSSTDTNIHAIIIEEPNVGASRSIRHPAVLAIWHQYIAPRVLATHTNFSRRAPPCVHPKRVADLLVGVDKVTMAPIYLIVEVLERVLALTPLEKMLLPHLIAGGCADLSYGGIYTLGLDPNVSEASLIKLQAEKEDAESLVVLGPTGGGWGSDDRPQKAAEELAEKTKHLWLEATQMAGEMIDCGQLEQIMDYWCPQHEARLGLGVPVDKVQWRSFLETRLEDNRQVTLRAELMLHSRKYIGADGSIDLRTQGVRSKLGVRGVFRSAGFVFIAAVRLWKGTPSGLSSYLEAKIKRGDSNMRAMRDRLKVAEAARRRAQGVAAADDPDMVEFVRVERRLLDGLADATALSLRLAERLKVAKAQRQDPPRSHPLKIAIQCAVASLIWIDEDKNKKPNERLPTRIVEWFRFVCSLDTSKALLMDTRNGTFLVRYSMEPGVFVASWSEGRGKPLKSARIFRVQYTRSNGNNNSDDEDVGPQEPDSNNSTPRDSNAVNRVTSSRSASRAASTRPNTGVHSLASTAPSTAPPEEITEVGFGWSAAASMMELYPTIPSLLYASRGVLAHGAHNEVPQLDRHAGYL